MTRRMMVSLIAAVLCLSFAPQAVAQVMPDHVHKALGKLVGGWTMETVVGDRKFMSVANFKWSDDQTCLIGSAKGKSFVTGEDITTTEILGWDEAKKLVVEYAINGDGSGGTGTYMISEDGQWTGPLNGFSIIEGAPVYFEVFRLFNWKSDDEVQVKLTHMVGSAQRSPDMTVTFRRK